MTGYSSYKRNQAAKPPATDDPRAVGEAVVEGDREDLPLLQRGDEEKGAYDWGRTPTASERMR